MNKLIMGFAMISLYFCSFVQANAANELDVSSLTVKEFVKNDFSSVVNHTKKILQNLSLAKECLEVEKKKVAELEKKRKFWLNSQRNKALIGSLDQAIDHHLQRASICQGYWIAYADKKSTYNDFVHAFNKSPALLLRKYSNEQKMGVNELAEISLFVNTRVMYISIALGALLVLRTATLFQRRFKRFDSYFISKPRLSEPRSICTLLSIGVISALTLAYIALVMLKPDSPELSLLLSKILLLFSCAYLFLALINNLKESDAMYQNNKLNYYIAFVALSVFLSYFIFSRFFGRLILNSTWNVNDYFVFAQAYTATQTLFGSFLVCFMAKKYLKNRRGVIGSVMIYLLLVSVLHDTSFVFFPAIIVLFFFAWFVFEALQNIAYKNNVFAKFICKHALISKDNKFHEFFVLNFFFAIFFFTKSLLLMLGINFYRIISEEVHLFAVSFSVKQLAILCLTFFVLRLLLKILSNLMFPDKDKNIREEHAKNNNSKYLLTLYVGTMVTLLFSFYAAGISLEGILIIFGALSVGIGMSMKSIINNFISGMMLLAEKSIQTGDFIQAGEFEGTVIKTGIRATQIRTLGNCDVFIPNEKLVSEYVTHFGFETDDVTLFLFFSVDYESDLAKIEEIILNILERNPDVLMKNEEGKPCSFISVSKISKSALSIRVAIRMSNIRLREGIKTYVHSEIIKEFTKHNIKLPYPKQEIMVNNSQKAL